MKREDLHKGVREKFLFEGSTSVGKTWTSLNITKLYALNGKKVLYIDPEDGAQREIDSGGIFDNLSDEQLDRIEIIRANDIETYLKYAQGWIEDKSIGSQEIKIHHGVEYDLKICDGIMTEIELYKTRLTSKFIKQGYYFQGEKQLPISNPDLFTLPYHVYAKLYDQLKDAINIMMEHKYDIICTTHPFKGTDAHKALQQNVYARFDSVIRLNKLELPDGRPLWNAIIVKNRGKESPDKSNHLDSVHPILSYFMKKFSMDIKEGMKILGIEKE